MSNGLKTGAQRVKEHRQRLRDSGLKEIRNLWAHPDDEQRIRVYAEKLARRREKASYRMSQQQHKPTAPNRR